MTAITARPLSPRKARALAALLGSRSTAAAARAAGVGRSRLFAWRKEDPTFRAALAEAREEIVAKAKAQAILAVVGAVIDLSGIARDPAAPFGARVRAAEAVLRLALQGENTGTEG